MRACLIVSAIAAIRVAAASPEPPPAATELPAGERDIALEEKRGVLFVRCEEGKAVALDVAHDGKRLGVAETGKGVDIIAYNEWLKLLYVPGGDSATMTIIAAGQSGDLKVLGTMPTTSDAHSVAADDLGNAYVCDPTKGRLLVFADRFPTDGP